MRCAKNFNAWSRHWLTEWAQFFSTMSSYTLHNQCFKSWMNWAMKFCLIHHIHLTSCQSTAAFSNFSTPGQLFAGKMLLEPAGGQKCSPIYWIPKQGFLWCRHKQTYFLLAKLLLHQLNCKTFFFIFCVIYLQGKVDIR